MAKLILLCPFSTLGRMVTPQLWALLNPAHQYLSFGTLESKIRHTVMEISTYLALVAAANGDDRRALQDVELSRTSYWTANNSYIISTIYSQLCGILSISQELVQNCNIKKTLKFKYTAVVFLASSHI